MCTYESGLPKLPSPDGHPKICLLGAWNGAPATALAYTLEHTRIDRPSLADGSLHVAVEIGASPSRLSQACRRAISTWRAEDLPVR